MTKAELIEVAEAMYSDPVVDEDRFVRFRRALRKVKKAAKEAAPSV